MGGWCSVFCQLELFCSRRASRLQSESSGNKVRCDPSRLPPKSGEDRATKAKQSARRERQGKIRWRIWQRVKLWVTPKDRSVVCPPSPCFDHTNRSGVSGEEALWQRKTGSLKALTLLPFPRANRWAQHMPNHAVSAACFWKDLWSPTNTGKSLNAPALGRKAMWTRNGVRLCRKGSQIKALLLYLRLHSLWQLHYASEMTQLCSRYEWSLMSDVLKMKRNMSV